MSDSRLKEKKGNDENSIINELLTEFYFKEAYKNIAPFLEQKLLRSIKMLNRSSSTLGAYSDVNSLCEEISSSLKSGDYTNTQREAVRITAGWTGAWLMGSTMAQTGAALCAPLSPVGSAICAVTGGILGSMLGYHAVSDLSVKLFDVTVSNQPETEFDLDASLKAEFEYRQYPLSGGNYPEQMRSDDSNAPATYRAKWYTSGDYLCLDDFVTDDLQCFKLGDVTPSANSSINSPLQIPDEYVSDQPNVTDAKALKVQFENNLAKQKSALDMNHQVSTIKHVQTAKTDFAANLDSEKKLFVEIQDNLHQHAQLKKPQSIISAANFFQPAKNTDMAKFIRTESENAAPPGFRSVPDVTFSYTKLEQIPGYFNVRNNSEFDSGQSSDHHKGYFVQDRGDCKLFSTSVCLSDGRCSGGTDLYCRSAGSDSYSYCGN